MPAPGDARISEDDPCVAAPTAVGAYIFAGGFTVGVKLAGYEVLAHLEGDGYGVSSARLNWPDLPIYVGPANWPTAALRERGVDLVYSNPPCAIFSAMGIRTTRGADGWRTDPRLGCWWNAFELLGSIRPQAWALESVTQAYTTGRPLIDELTKRALLLGYSVTHLFVDASWFGLPQRRRRFFIVAHRAARLTTGGLNWAPPPTVGEVLREVDEPGHHVECKPHAALMPHTRPGEGLSTAWERLNPPETRRRGARGQVIGRPSFKDGRLHPDRTMGAYLGDAYLHPTENRRLGINEARALGGYPPDFQLGGDPRGWGSLLARAVMPPVGRWLAERVASTLSLDSADWPERRVTRVDLRRPGIDPVDLTADYLDDRGRVRLRVRVDGTPVLVAPPRPERPVARSTVDRPSPVPVAPPVVATPPEPVVDERPQPGEGSGAFIKRLWRAGLNDPDRLVKLVHANWAGRRTRRSDVYFNYAALVREHGAEAIPPWPRAPTSVERPAIVVSPAASDGRPRALITGMTATHVGSTRRPLQIATAGDCWHRALEALGYAVDQRPVTIGEDLTGYAAVLVGFCAPKAIVAQHLLPALWLLGNRPDAVGFLDDWQTREIAAGFRSHAREDRLWKLPHLRQRDVGQTHRDLIQATAERYRNGRAWPIPLIVCTLGRPGDLDLLRLPSAELVPLDPSSFWDRYPTPQPAPTKERRWLWASLLKKFEQLEQLQSRAAWPVIAFGARDRVGSGYGAAGARALPRRPEPELVPEYARSWGVITPEHPISGSGWWRVRYLIARDVGSIVVGPPAEAALLGPSYQLEAAAVEALTDDGLAELAAAQRTELDAATWPRERALDALHDLLERRGARLP